jgi:predicted transcriptional regulator
MNVNFRLDPAIVALLREQAAKEGSTPSQIIRQAILMYLGKVVR